MFVMSDFSQLLESKSKNLSAIRSNIQLDNKKVDEKQGFADPEHFQGWLPWRKKHVNMLTSTAHMMKKKKKNVLGELLPFADMQ